MSPLIPNYATVFGVLSPDPSISETKFMSLPNKFVNLPRIQPNPE